MTKVLSDKRVWWCAQLQAVPQGIWAREGHPVSERNPFPCCQSRSPDVPLADDVVDYGCGYRYLGQRRVE